MEDENFRSMKIVWHFHIFANINKTNKGSLLFVDYNPVFVEKHSVDRAIC